MSHFPGPDSYETSSETSSNDDTPEQDFFPQMGISSSQLEEGSSSKNMTTTYYQEGFSSIAMVGKFIVEGGYPDSLRPSKEHYQIFLCFRGKDTRYNFTDHLYHALKQEGFKVFMDDQAIETGDPIPEAIVDAIENSKLSIIIFSEHFADSTWCLNELVKILECNQKKEQRVWPIFYKVEVSDVRHQRNSYEIAMVEQETKFGKNSEEVTNWKAALFQICNLKGLLYNGNCGPERDFIQGIVKAANKIRDQL